MGTPRFPRIAFGPSKRIADTRRRQDLLLTGGGAGQGNLSAGAYHGAFLKVLFAIPVETSSQGEDR